MQNEKDCLGYQLFADVRFLQESLPQSLDGVCRRKGGMVCLNRVSPSFFFNLIQTDPDDNKFVDCAVCGNAEYIVSNDSHFRVLNDIDWPKIKLVTIQEYVKEIDI